MTRRTIDVVLPALREDVAELHTFQAIPDSARAMLDPFLLLAHHGPQTYGPNNSGLPFGPHPHRGFETVTFIRSGMLAHHDSGGHQSVIGEGGVQWMTAGSGLIHAEVSPPEFRRIGGRIEILQLWINLPSRLKMSPPRYVGLHGAAIPAFELAGGAHLVLVSGNLDTFSGAVRSLTDVFLGVLELTPSSQAELPAPRGRGVLLYVVEGNVEIDGGRVGARQVVALKDDGDEVHVSSSDGATILYGHAERLREPIVAGGPFIMNSQAEIEQAFADYRAKRFDGVPIAVEVD